MNASFKNNYNSLNVSKINGDGKGLRIEKLIFLIL